MRKRWIISDTHFNHNNPVMLIDCGRPENHTQLTIANWQRMVAPEDIVYHLGDVIVGKAATLPAIMKTLPGYKIVIRGNHDERLPWLLKRGFDEAYDSLVVGETLLTHKPADTLPEGCRVNIHGHFHNTDHHIFEPTYTPQPWHMRLSLEWSNYCPVRFYPTMREAFSEGTK